ncbi:MAG: MoxR family ATPase [Methylocella sp.]
MELEKSADATLADWRVGALQFESEVNKAVLGQKRAIRLVTISTFARGHVLLEGDVGVGKTTLLRSVARAIGGAYERVEGAIDLMPSDLIYQTFLSEDGRPRVEPGPVLRQGDDLSIFFFNEINRARPQVHSLLLRLMAERSVSAFNKEYAFPHLVIFADRNRVEKEETFELPAAARDRFFMEIGIETPADLEVRRQLIFEPRYHDIDALVASVKEGVLDYRKLGEIGRLIQRSVRTSDSLQRYVLDLWSALRRPAEAGIEVGDIDMRRLVQGGASPRGLSFLVQAARVRAWLEDRDMVVPEDIREVFVETMAHRIFLDPIYELRRDAIVRDLCRAAFASVPAP